MPCRLHPFARGFTVLQRALYALPIVASLLLASPCRAQGVATWNAIGPAGGPVSALLVVPSDPSVLFAATPHNGVFVSANGGATWNAANAGLATSSSGRRTEYAIRALETDGRHVFAATDAGLFYADASPSPAWLPLAPTASTTPITQLAFERLTARLFAASRLSDGASAAGVYVTPIVVSDTPAPSWSFVALPSGLAVDALAIAAVPGQPAATLMASASGSLYVATILPNSAGLGWVNADPTGSLAANTIDTLAFSADLGLALACSGAALFYSGNPFDAQPLWLPATVASAAWTTCKGLVSIPIAAGGAPQVLLGTDGGAFVSLDGTSYAATGALAPGGSATTFATDSSPQRTAPTFFVGGSAGISAAPVASVSGGVGWTPSNGPASVATGGANLRLNNTNVVDTATIGSTLYAAAVTDDYSEVWKSSDGGTTWTATGIGVTLRAGERILGLTADASNTVLYAATTQGLLGLGAARSWSAVGAATIPGRASALAVGADAVFVGTDNGVYAVPRSPDPTTATPVAAGLPGMSVRSLLAAGPSLYAGTIDASDQNFVFFADEAAAAHATAVWNAFGIGSAGIDRIAALLLVGDSLLAATQGSLVLYASAGSGWASANSSSDMARQISDPFGVVNHLHSDGSTIYAATGSNGVFVSAGAPPFAWAGWNGDGSTALPSLEVHTLRASNGALYAATRAGVASNASPAAPSASAPASGPGSPETGSAAGGGATGPFLVLLLLAAAIALRRTRP